MGKRGNNEGTITKRADGRWEARISLDNGKRKSFYGKTRKEVAAKLTKALRDQQQHLPIVSERVTMAAFLTRWLDDVAHPSLRARTFESYAMIINHHLIPTLGKRRLATLTPQDVQHYMNEKRTEGLSVRTVTYHRAVLRKALNDGLRWGVVGRNVAALATPPKQERAERRYLTPAEARTLLAAVEGDPLGPMVITTLGLGLRQGEALGLRWGDIDLDRGIADLRMQVQRITGQGLILVPLKSTASQAAVPLPAIVIEALRKQRIQVLEQRIAAGPLWNDHDLVFPSRIGTPRDPHNLARAWQAFRTRAGLDWLPFHGLRHGFGSLLAAQGVHPRVAMQQMRHSQFSLTMEVYTHVAPDLARDAALQIDRALSAS